MTDVGIVAIGRNEARRLPDVLESLMPYRGQVIYVDSGSTDGSVQIVRKFGFPVHELSSDRPFCAARARNEGARLLTSQVSSVRFIQFIDADCELVGDWLEMARSTLVADKSIAAVCGRRREKNPNGSIYNRAVDVEWRIDPGETPACGGDRMVTVEAFRKVGGYNELLIAGEDPDLCMRFRVNGYRSICIDRDMTVHDINMRGFSEWWRRSKRTGYAYAKGHAVLRKADRSYKRRELFSIVFWVILPPIVIGGLWPFISGWSMALLVFYPLQIVRIAARGYLIGLENIQYGMLLIAGKFAEFAGLLKYCREFLFGKGVRVIEYSQDRTGSR